MSNSLQNLEKLLYKIRDVIWYYPDTVLWGEKSLSFKAARVYLLARPVSHFIASGFICLILVILLFGTGKNIVFARGQQVLVEGVVTGTDELGHAQTLSKISPLLPTAIQLEKDLSELIYEPLIRVKPDGKVENVLASEVIRIQEGAEYEFVLRPNVKWQDYRPGDPYFGVDDVMRTLDIVSNDIDENNTNSYAQAIKQMAWEKTGEHSIRICTVSSQKEVANLPNKCSGYKGQKPILSNFLELISIKIIPAHLAKDINRLNIDKSELLLNRLPVGTGKYKFAGASENQITLQRNDDYYGEKPSISQIQFKLFKSEDQAISALQNGEIHSFATNSTESLREMDRYKQVKSDLSPVLYNQYWAIYFNLRQKPDGSSIGPEFFQDAKVRQAISSAVDRGSILDVLSNVGKEAVGPIPQNSYFFNSKAKFFRYNKGKAMSLLDAAGWNLLDSDGIRIKDGKRLSFKLTYVDNYDRRLMVSEIIRSLKEVGVEVIPDPRSLGDIATLVVAPKLFDTLLYGMSTFVDPDRFELFDSQEAGKLNLASYKGSEIVLSIEDGKQLRVPKVDKALKIGKSLDPLLKSKRKEQYDTFQELVAQDAPVIFLQHPQFIYYTNQRLRNVDLTGVGAVEQRFENIDTWDIGV